MNQPSSNQPSSNQPSSNQPSSNQQSSIMNQQSSIMNQPSSNQQSSIMNQQFRTSGIASAFNKKNQEYGFVFLNHKRVYMNLLKRESHITKSYDLGGRVKYNIK